MPSFSSSQRKTVITENRGASSFSLELDDLDRHLRAMFQEKRERSQFFAPACICHDPTLHFGADDDPDQ